MQLRLMPGEHYISNRAVGGVGGGVMAELHKGNGSRNGHVINVHKYINERQVVIFAVKLYSRLQNQVEQKTD